MTTSLLIIFIGVFIILIARVIGGKPMSEKEQIEQRERMNQVRKDIARINWHTSEVNRLSKLINSAIREGRMLDYEKLKAEKQTLDELYKREFPQYN